MSALFPSPSLAARMEVGAKILLAEQKATSTDEDSPVTQYIGNALQKFRDDFHNRKYTSPKLREDGGSLWNLEALGRYMRLVIHRAIELDPNQRAILLSIDPNPRPHSQALAEGTVYPRELRFNFPKLERYARTILKGEINIAVPTTTISDLTIARVWFARNKPNPGETTWDLYKRFDPQGVCAMNQAQFFSLIPMSWREVNNYQIMMATYQDCLQLESWFKGRNPKENENSWDLYTAFDPDGTRAMHQAHFFTVLPKAFAVLPRYAIIELSYQTCAAVDKWCRSIDLNKVDDIAQCFRDFPQNEKEPVLLRDLYLLAPLEWRKKFGPNAFSMEGKRLARTAGTLKAMS